MIKIKISVGGKDVYVFPAYQGTEGKENPLHIVVAVICALRHHIKSKERLNELIAIKAAIMAYEADCTETRRITVKAPKMTLWKLAARLKIGRAHV